MVERLSRIVFIASVIVSVLTVWPAVARAQMYFSVSAGGNHTSPADVTVNVPASGLAVTYHDVQFSARSLTSPQYYVWRLGKFFGSRQRVGVEFEFTHLKVISDTSKSYVASGTIDGVLLPGGTSVPMNAAVQEYQMTHGLNFLLFNIVARLPIGSSGRLALVARAGTGPTLPHGETNVLGQFRQGYEWAGVGVEGSAGLALKLSRLLTVIADYKISHARPEITVAGGSGQTTALTQQVAVGLAIGFAR
jgi:hypothetical protein